MAKPKKPTKSPETEDLQELYVEPPLIYRLFPTLLKGRKPSQKALEKQLAKAAKPIEIKPRLPIADLLPHWLVEEVKRRTVSRQFILAYILVIAAIGAVTFNVWRDTQYQQGQVDAAREQVTQAQRNFTTVAPLVEYAVKVRDAAEYGNAQARNQLDNSAVLSAVTGATPRGITVNGITITFGSAAAQECSTGGDSSPFSDSGQSAAGIGCVSFDGVAADAESMETYEARLLETNGFEEANIFPGQVDDRGRYLFTGNALIGEPFRIEQGPALFLNVTDLPDESPLTAVQASNEPSPSEEEAQ